MAEFLSCDFIDPEPSKRGYNFCVLPTTIDQTLQVRRYGGMDDNFIQWVSFIIFESKVLWEMVLQVQPTAINENDELYEIYDEIEVV